MTIRSKLFLIFGFLAILPMLSISFVFYYRSVNSIKTMLKDQTAVMARRVAEEISNRYSTGVSDVILLSENEQTQDFYRAYISHDVKEFEKNLSAIRNFLQLFYDYKREYFVQGTFYDNDGRRLITFGEDLTAPFRERIFYFESIKKENLAGFSEATLSNLTTREDLEHTPIIHLGGEDYLRISRDILDIENGERLGFVSALLSLSYLLPRPELEQKIGQRGHSVVLESQTMKLLFRPPGTTPELGGVRKETMSAQNQSIEYKNQGGRWIASYVNLEKPGITVMTIGSYDEFASQAERTSMITLLITILAILLVATAIIFLTRRTTSSLKMVTDAAEAISLGDLDQEVQISSKDEIKVLADAFNRMSARLKTMIKEVERSKSMAAIGQFASSIAHEIRNPLTSIKMNLQMLMRKKDLKEKEKSQIKLCLGEVDKLSKVVKGTLELAKVPDYKFVVHSITEIINHSLQLLEKQLEDKKISVTKEYQKDLPEIKCSDVGLEEVFLNIFLNAIDAVETGGSITVKSYLINKDERDFLVVEITDNGRGIPSESLNVIFDPFYTTKKEGIGLGLSIAAKVVEQHGGEIEVESRINEGTTFKILLPVVQ